MFLSYHPKINEWLWLDDYLAFVGISCMKLCIIFIYFDSISQWLYVLFQPSAKLKLLISISSLIKIYIWEIPLQKEKLVYFQSGLCCYLNISFTTLGIFWVITNWCHCRRTKVQINPGRNDKVYKDQEKIYVGKQEFLLVKKVVYLPWRF